MKIIVLTLALLATLTASAQNIAPQQEVAPRNKIKEHLASPAQRDSLTIVNETVQITEQGDAATIVGKNLEVAQKAVNGYRIVIFMSNSQTARRDAVAAQENVTTLFPQEQSYLSYENPYFKVTIGNFLTQEEAVVILGRIQKSFPKAFITQAHISTREFAK